MDKLALWQEVATESLHSLKDFFTEKEIDRTLHCIATGEDLSEIYDMLTMKMQDILQARNTMANLRSNIDTLDRIGYPEKGDEDGRAEG